MATCLLNYVETDFLFQFQLLEYKLLYRMPWYQRVKMPFSPLSFLPQLLAHGS